MSRPLNLPQSERRLPDYAVGRNNSQGFADVDAAATGAVIVSASDVYVYTEIGKLTAKITGITFPAGLAIDAANNLYIANSGRGGQGSTGVLVYKNDYKTLIAILADPYPSSGVSVDATSGLVAVTNFDPNNVANVTFYAKGSLTPCTDLKDSRFLQIQQGAFDNAGNLYVTGLNLDFTQFVGVITGGCSATGVTVLSTANTLSSNLWGIQITKTGDVAVEDQTNSVIYTYNKPVKKALGTPVAVTRLSSETGAPYQFAFTKDGAYFFVGDDAQSKTFKYAYPAGGSAVKYIAPQNSPFGVVVTRIAK